MAHTYIQVICEPGVQIYLNDTFEGTTNWADGGLSINTPAGKYTVKAQKAGFATREITLSLKKSDVKVWELKALTPLKDYKPATSSVKQTPYGTLIVHSYPAQCEIILVSPSGSETSWPKRKTQWKAQKIPYGKYTVKAKALGKTLSYDIEILPAGGVELIFDFSYGGASLRSQF